MLGEEVSFNNSPSHFEPTDVLTIKRGQTISEVLNKSGFKFLLENKRLLNVILFWNGMAGIKINSPLTNTIRLMLNHPKMYLQSYRGHPCFEAYRNRSFTLFESKIEDARKNSVLNKLRKNSDASYKILEIGCGTGRALLDLQKEFPRSEIIGICSPGEAEDLNRVRYFYEFAQSKSQLPKVCEIDLNSESLDNFKYGFFDFIFSQATLRYIRDKATLIKDIWHLLRPGGGAIIHIQLMQVLDQTNKNVPLKDFFNKKQWQKQIHYDHKTGFLYIFKTSDFEIDFDLRLLARKTKHKTANKIPLKNLKVGWSSVYKVIG